MKSEAPKRAPKAPETTTAKPDVKVDEAGDAGGVADDETLTPDPDTRSVSTAKTTKAVKKPQKKVDMSAIVAWRLDVDDPEVLYGLWRQIAGTKVEVLTSSYKRVSKPYALERGSTQTFTLSIDPAELTVVRAKLAKLGVLREVSAGENQGMATGPLGAQAELTIVVAGAPAQLQKGYDSPPRKE